MKRMLLLVNLTVVLLVALMLVPPAPAQVDTGIIQGLVRDVSGAAIPNAPVAITETQTNIRYNVSTDAQGNYVSPPLRVGIYSVRVSATGFKTYERTGIVLQVQDRLRVDAGLVIGTLTETVVVSGEAAQVQTDSSSLGQVIQQQQLVDMPLNGRNYTSMMAFQTGVQNTGSEGYYTANGVRNDLNNFMLDGVDNNSNDSGISALNVNLEAIAEFKVQSSSYDAEFGRAGGAAVNVVIKSGTNQLHGALFEFYQNAYLNAENFFATVRPLSAKYNQPGATLGGPIIKNKLFFFGDWQYTVQHTPTVYKSSVPVFGEATGNFSGGIPGVKTIYDPNTYNASTGQRTPFANNTIPQGEMSPTGLAYAALYPAANVPGAVTNNYIYEPTNLTQIMQGDGRLDYRMSDADSIFARYTQAGQTRVVAHKMPGLACGCSYSSGNTFQPRKGGSVGETHIFTPTMVNEFRAGFNWYFQTVGVPDGGYQSVPSNLAIPGIVANPSYQGLGSIAPRSYNTLGLAGGTPTWVSTRETQLRDTLNLVRGRHTIRMGGEIRWSQYNIFQNSALRGQMSFNGQFTSQTGGSGGNGLADLLLGNASSAYVDTAVYVGDRQYVPALFVQDDFKVSHNLTLNLGLRYEYYSPLVDVHNQIANFNYATGRLEVAPGAGGVDGCTVCVLGSSNALSTWQKANFAPRIGFAYTPFKDTVIRGAFGLFYSGQEVRTAEPTQLQFNLPFYYQPTFASDGINPLITFATGFPPLNPAQAINPGATSLDTYVKTPYLQEWNVAVQRALPGKMSLEVAYVGTKAVHLEGVSDQNQVMVPGPGDVQSRRPYPFFGPFASLQNRGNSWYNALQMKLQKNLSHGLYFLSSFTFAKSLNDFPTINDGLSVDNSYNLKAYKQPANFYRPLSWVTSFDYLLPFGQGTALLNKSKALDLIVGGWHTTGILTLTHGGVFTPTMSYDSSNTGTQGMTLPDRLRNGALSGSQRTLDEWFDITAFVDAQQYTFGNSGYGVLYGPGLINLDFGLRKIFNITERQKLQLRAEAFNALNHPYFSNPDAGIDDGPGAAGAITSTQGSNRVVQIGLKYQF